MATMISKFAGTCTACKQRFNAGTQISWAKGLGARHIACPTVQAPSVPITVVLDLIGIVRFIQQAKDRGLKFPKARFLAPGNEEMRLSLAGAKSKAPGSLQVVVRGEWVGRVEPSGRVVGRLHEDTLLQNTLAAIASDPAAAAKAYGALMCRCSFCNLPLTDAGSVEAGYGPICADKWHLPHTALGTRKLGAWTQAEAQAL